MHSLIELVNTHFDERDEDGNEMPNVFTHSPYYSSEEAITMLNHKKKILTILSLNCQSLNAKIDQIQVYLTYFRESLCQFSVIALQETWLSSEHDTSILQIDDYNFVYKPKLASQHGGVGFFIMNNIEYKILPITVDDDICDSMFIEVSLNSTEERKSDKVILGNIYRPPRAENYDLFIEKFEQTITKLSHGNI